MFYSSRREGNKQQKEGGHKWNEWPKEEKNKKMTQCSDPENNHYNIIVEGRKDSLIRTCPTCGHHIKCQEQVLLLIDIIKNYYPFG